MLLRAPAQPPGGCHVLFDHYWVETGDQPLPEPAGEGKGVGFVATASVQGHMRSLARAALMRRYPVLLQVTHMFFLASLQSGDPAYPEPLSSPLPLHLSSAQ